MPQLDVAESVLAKVAQWKKQAEGGVADGLAGLTSSMDPAAAAAAEQAMRYTAVGAGLGVGAGGLYALLNARRQKRESEQTARQAPTGVVLDLPVKAALATPLPWASAQDEIVKKYPHVSFPEKMSPGMLAAGIGAESAGRGLGYAIPGAAIGALTGDGALRGAAIGGGAGVGATLGGHAADQVAAHFGGSPMTRALGGLGGAVAGIGLGGYLGHKLVPLKKTPEEEEGLEKLAEDVLPHWGSPVITAHRVGFSPSMNAVTSRVTGARNAGLQLPAGSTGAEHYDKLFSKQIADIGPMRDRRVAAADAMGLWTAFYPKGDKPPAPKQPVPVSPFKPKPALRTTAPTALPMTQSQTPTPNKAASLANARDVLPGGLGDKRKLTDFSGKAVRQGMKVESEHTKNPLIAADITKDHLTENENYYNQLRKMEKGAAAGPDELAWATPARVLGGVGGAYLGFKGIQTLADKLNETQRQKRLEQAREEFSKALTGQFQAPLNLKAASVGERLGVALDRLYDLMQKDAGLGSTVAGAALNPGGTYNKALGKYLGYWAVPTGLLGAYAGWRHGRKNTDAVAVEKARKLRLHQQFQESPPAMFVRPNPVPIAQGEDDEETSQGQIAA